MSARAIKASHPARSGRTMTLMILVLVIIVGISFMPTTIVVVAGLIPTLAAFVADQSARRSVTLTIGFMNAAGIVPSIIDLWQSGQTVEHSFTMVQNATMYLVAYGAAGCGWMIYFIVPPVVRLMLAQSVKLHIKELEEEQAALRRIWGEEVRPTTTPTSPEQPHS
jgi:hypothetical protein